MYRCQNLDCVYLKYFAVDHPDDLFIHCTKLNEVSLQWHDLNVTSFLSISNHLLRPLGKLSYLQVQDSSKLPNYPTCLDCPTCRCTDSECETINKANEILDKACHVHMQCIKNGTQAKNITKADINSKITECEYGTTIWKHYYIFGIAGKCIL